MIKSVFLAALAAVASAEADAQLVLGGHGLAYGAHLPVPVAHAPYAFASVGAVANHPVVKSVVEVPAVATHEVTAHHVPVAVGYHGYGHGYYGKREADAAVLDGHTRVISAPTPLIHNPPVVHHPVAVAHHGLGYGLGHLGLGYGAGLGHLGLGAGLGLHGLGYGLPLAHAVVKREADAAVIDGHTRVVSAPTPLIHNAPIAHHAVAVPHHAAYAGLGHLGLGYGAGLGHLGLGYGAGLGLHGLGHGLPLAHAVVKREADAQLVLGGHGLAYGAHLPVPVAHAPYAFAPVGAVAHHPVVKSVVEEPAVATHEVTAHHVPVAVGYHGYGLGHGLGHGLGPYYG